MALSIEDCLVIAAQFSSIDLGFFYVFCVGFMRLVFGFCNVLLCASVTLRVSALFNAMGLAHRILLIYLIGNKVYLCH